jgi:hypothetical protein
MIQSVIVFALEPESKLSISCFAADITPPLGSPLLAGFITRTIQIDDKLQARGIVILGAEKPIVLCSLDWAETNNSSYDYWREELAKAAGTDASRVAVQSIHPHNTPWANLEANQLLQEASSNKISMMDPIAFAKAVKTTADALKESLNKSKKVTHIGIGKAKVEKVASARRILNADGTKIEMVRMSKSMSEKERNAPEGLIDPFLRTISFWNGEKAVAALHYYAVHPMSYYGDGHVSCDFCGLARDARQKEQEDIFQVYFTGCAGNISPGKYNDGSHENRIVLRDRIHAGMIGAWNDTKRTPISAPKWSTIDIKLPARTDGEFHPDQLKKLLNNSKATVKNRSRAAIKLTYQARVDKPIELSSLEIGEVRILHLPGEPFIEYQLYAQELLPKQFVCVAGYGDGGPGYIPMKNSYEEGGYEPTMSFITPESEQILKTKISELLGTQK